jgi:hypothetical protein
MMEKRLQTVMLGLEKHWWKTQYHLRPFPCAKTFAEDATREARSFDERCAEHKRDREKESSRSVSPFKIKSRRYTSRQISLGTRSQTTAEKGHVLYVCRHVYMHEFRSRIHYVAVKKSQSGDQRNRSPANYFALAAALANPVHVYVCVCYAALCVLCVSPTAPLSL